MKNKLYKKIILLLALLLCVMNISVESFANEKDNIKEMYNKTYGHAGNYGVQQAMSWLYSNNGRRVGGGQCASLISAYYNYLGYGSPGITYAKDYATSSSAVPAGMNRLSSSTSPQVGDILVYSGCKHTIVPETGVQAGHIAIYENPGSIWHQNSHGNGIVTQRTDGDYMHSDYDDKDSVLIAIIRPQFANLPYGVVEELTCPKPGYIEVSGWALDWFDVSKAINLTISVGGDPSVKGSVQHVATANLYHSTLTQSYPGAGPMHGFRATINTHFVGLTNVYVIARGTYSGDVYINGFSGTKTAVNITGINSSTTQTPAQTQTQTPAKYKVSFVANGGSGTMGDRTGLSGTFTLPLNAFTPPAGKRFKGWSLSPSGQIVKSVNMDSDKTVYAIWEDSSNNGGATGGANAGVINPAEGITNDAIQTNPTDMSIIQQPTIPVDVPIVQQPTIPNISQQESQGSIYRLLNPGTGEHLYTTDINELRVLVSGGWKQENSMGQSSDSGLGVYRLYNPSTGEHLYSADTNECKVLTSGGGWRYDNSGRPIFYGVQAGQIAVYRLYNVSVNPVASHHYTSDANEVNALVSNGGWVYDNNKRPVYYLQ